VVNDLVPAEGIRRRLFGRDTLYRGGPSAARRAISEPGVGGVCGELVLRSAAGSAGRGEMSYWSYGDAPEAVGERVRDDLGATGGVYAIRRDLFAPLPVDRPVVDDFLTPLQVVRRGYRMVYEPRRSPTRTSDSIGRDFAAASDRRPGFGSIRISPTPESGAGICGVRARGTRSPLCVPSSPWPSW